MTDFPAKISQVRYSSTNPGSGEIPLTVKVHAVLGGILILSGVTVKMGCFSSVASNPDFIELMAASASIVEFMLAFPDFGLKPFSFLESWTCSSSAISSSFVLHCTC